MFFALTPFLGILATALPQDGTLFCEGSFYEAGHSGSIRLRVDPDYTPREVTVSLSEPDGWSRATIVLDPTTRRFPGNFTGAFFAVRFTEKPVFPLKMTGYADGIARWHKDVAVPFWHGSALDAPLGKSGGTADYVARADDGLPVVTPRALRIVMIDARGRQVAETLLALPGGEPDAKTANALAAAEAAYRARKCAPPPPLID